MNKSVDSATGLQCRWKAATCRTDLSLFLEISRFPPQTICKSKWNNTEISSLLDKQIHVKMNIKCTTITNTNDALYTYSVHSVKFTFKIFKFACLLIASHLQHTECKLYNLLLPNQFRQSLKKKQKNTLTKCVPVIEWGAQHLMVSSHMLNCNSFPLHLMNYSWNYLILCRPWFKCAIKLMKKQNVRNELLTSINDSTKKMSKCQYLS